MNINLYPIVCTDDFPVPVGPMTLRTKALLSRASGARQYDERTNAMVASGKSSTASGMDSLAWVCMMYCGSQGGR